MSVEPCPGMLLIAAPALQDPNFCRTVVLLCDHGPMSTMGIGINRPMRVTIEQFFPQFKESSTAHPSAASSTQPSTPPIFSGGPVETNRLLVVRDGSAKGEAAAKELELSGDLFHPVCPGVELVADIDTVMGQASREDLQRYRFFLGYAGWGEGQLAQELAEGSWILCPATPELVFGTPPQLIWAESLRSLGGIHGLLAEMPHDPSLN